MSRRWFTMPRHPDYEISASGIVRRRTPGHSTWPGRRLAVMPNGKGYLCLTLYDRIEFVHVLVCETFHGPRPSPKHEAAHCNGRRTDNRRGNTCWKTKSENRQDIARHGNRRSRWVAPHLSDRQRVEIRRKARHIPQVVLAGQYGISAPYVSILVNGRVRK